MNIEKAEFYETAEANLSEAAHRSAQDRIGGGYRVLDALTAVIEGDAVVEPELEDNEIRALSRRASDTILNAQIELKAPRLDSTPLN